MDYLLGTRYCEIKKNYLKEKEINWGGEQKEKNKERKNLVAFVTNIILKKRI